MKLEFKHDFVSKTIVRKMNFADYGAELEDNTILPIVFERKSCSDLYGTLGKGNRRFKRELERCIEANFKMYLIIEGTFTKISKGHRYSKLKPHTLLRILGTMWDKYEKNFQPIFCRDRTEMQNVILWRFFSAAKEHIKNTKKKR